MRKSDRRITRTKLKFTIASFIAHALLAVGFLVTDQTTVWAYWFASFNSTLAIYTASKTMKDKILIDSRDDIKKEKE